MLCVFTTIFFKGGEVEKRIIFGIKTQVNKKKENSTPNLFYNTFRNRVTSSQTHRLNTFFLF